MVRSKIENIKAASLELVLAGSGIDRASLINRLVSECPKSSFRRNVRRSNVLKVERGGGTPLLIAPTVTSTHVDAPQHCRSRH
jgi:hypothetical protein